MCAFDEATNCFSEITHGVSTHFLFKHNVVGFQLQLCLNASHSAIQRIVSILESPSLLFELTDELPVVALQHVVQLADRHLGQLVVVRNVGKLRGNGGGGGISRV